MGKRRLGDEVERLKEKLTEKESKINYLTSAINSGERRIVELQAKIKAARREERLRVIQEISGRGEEE